MAVGNAVPKLGWQSALGIAEETTWGTFVTSTAHIEFNSESFKHSREEVRLESINTTRDYKKRVIGNETVEGSFEADLDLGSDALMYVIKQAMGGTVGNSTISADEFVHTFNVGDMESNKGTSTASDVKGLSFAVRKGDTDVWNAAGCRINTLTIKGEVGSPVMISAEIIGQLMSISSTIATVSLSDVTPAIFAGVVISTGATISAVSTEYFTSFEFVLTNNLDGDQRSLGSRNITVLPPLRRDVKLTLAQRFDTITAYNRFIQNTMTSIQILCNTTETIGATAGNTTYSMTIKIPAGYFNSNMPEVGGVDTLTHELDVSAMYQADPGYVTQILVRNGTANYW